MSVKKFRPTHLLIVGFCSVVYFKTLFYGITYADDEVLITGSLQFLGDFTNILRVFTTDAFYHVRSIDLYRPLQSASFIIDAQWGMNPVFSAHLTNLVLHVLCCLTIFHLLQRLEVGRTLALCGSLIYTVHYLFLTAVAWIPARGDLLLALFTFLSLLTFIRMLENRGWSDYLLHGICSTLAFFSKESAVVLPLLLAVYVVVYDKFSVLTRRIWLLPCYYGVNIALFFFLKSAAVTSPNGVVGIGSLLKNIHTLPEYVAKFYLPLNMSTFPEFKLSALLTGLMLMTGLAALVLHDRHEHWRRALFGIAWFFLLIMPGMTYYPNFYSFCFEHIDHRAYLPCFGLLLLNLQLAGKYALEEKKYFRQVMLLVLLALASLNFYFSSSYRNPAAFALRAISSGSRSALALSIYGAERFLQGEDLDALHYLNRSVRICSKFMPALHYRARIYRNRGMPREALADLDDIFSVDPKYDPADYVLRAEIKVELQDYSGARSDYEAALRLDPALADAARGLQNLLRRNAR